MGKYLQGRPGGTFVSLFDKPMLSEGAQALLAQYGGFHEAEEKWTVCLDFDGVIHSYKSGWQGIDVIPDPPVEGAKEAIAALRKEGKEVVVFSSRSKDPKGVKAIEDYLAKHGIEVDQVVHDKPPAQVYVDDRGVPFSGSWVDTLKDIQNFEHYMGESLCIVRSQYDRSVLILERKLKGVLPRVGPNGLPVEAWYYIPGFRSWQESFYRVLDEWIPEEAEEYEQAFEEEVMDAFVVQARKLHRRFQRKHDKAPGKDKQEVYIDYTKAIQELYLKAIRQGYEMEAKHFHRGIVALKNKMVLSGLGKEEIKAKLLPLELPTYKAPTKNPRWVQVDQWHRYVIEARQAISLLEDSGSLLETLWSLLEATTPAEMAVKNRKVWDIAKAMEAEQKAIVNKYEGNLSEAEYDLQKMLKKYERLIHRLKGVDFTLQTRPYEMVRDFTRMILDVGARLGDIADPLLFEIDMLGQEVYELIEQAEEMKGYGIIEELEDWMTRYGEIQQQYKEVAAEGQRLTKEIKKFLNRSKLKSRGEATLFYQEIQEGLAGLKEVIEKDLEQAKKSLERLEREVRQKARA